MNTFHERISSLVNESNKSLTDISNDLGIAKQTLSAWCTGQRKPKPITLSHVANYFHTTVAWLMGEDDKKHPINYKDLNGLAELKESIKDKLLFAASRNNSTYSIEIRFNEGEVVALLDGENCDLAKVFFMLDTNGRKNLLLDMLKRYC